MEPIVLNKVFITINQKKVFQRLGFHSTKTILTSPMKKLIEDEMDRFSLVGHPQTVYAHYSLKKTGGSEVLLEEPTILFQSSALAKRLNDCRRVSLFACTIGREMTATIKKCFAQREESRGIVLDAIGSVAVEELADIVNGFCVKQAEESGCLTVRRFSPGYQDWSLGDQKKIFRLLDPSRIGITLTGSSIMEPEKSITGIIGWKQRSLT